jgi:hypothetical protein
MGQYTQATMVARQKVMEAQNQVAECEKKVALLGNQLYTINNTTPKLQTQMAEWSIASLPIPVSSSATNIATASEKPKPTPEPEQPKEITSNLWGLVKKYWLYGVGGLLVVVWLVNRSMA